ncbi:hypothetical protein [Brevundimonas sp.]|uniref:hypothetical protein n=1 Tax=Brevundimonas sp. TaxID=1871086 RepID=UPI0035631A72
MPNRDKAEHYDLINRRTDWAVSVITRLSIRKALERRQDNQRVRRTSALTVAGAIYRIQDQTKAMRCFLTLSGWSVAVAIGYGYIAEPVVSAIWALNTPLLILNAEKAFRAKLEAAEAIAGLRRPSLP